MERSEQWCSTSLESLANLKWFPVRFGYVPPMEDEPMRYRRCLESRWCWQQHGFRLFRLPPNKKMELWQSPVYCATLLKWCTANTRTEGSNPSSSAKNHGRVGHGKAYSSRKRANVSKRLVSSNLTSSAKFTHAVYGGISRHASL